MDYGQNKPYGGQVYFDARTNQYYTMSQQAPLNNAFAGLANLGRRNDKTYLTGMPFGQGNQSTIGNIMANRQPYQYNAPSAQQLFPGMGNPMMGTMPTQAQGNPMLGGGNFGAGRFLGQGYANQAGLLGSPSTSMLGT